MTTISKRLAQPLNWRRTRPSDDESEPVRPAQNLTAKRPARALPIAVLAALGTTSLAVPAAAEAPTDRAAAELAKQPTTPTMVVLGASRRSSAITIKPGETLSHVSARTGVSVGALRRANGVGSNDMIYAGQRLTIPSKGSSSSSSSRSSSSSTRSSRSGGYSVRSGDTLSHIAQRQGVSLAALQAANPGVNPQALQPGQKLTIPTRSARTASSAGKKRAIGNTFAGRTYPEETVRAANTNHATLASRGAPNRDAMRQTIAATARRHGVDPSLAQAVAYQESGFNQRAVSPANAVGAMQVTPSAGRWASEMAGRELNLLDPEDNATAGVLVLKANLRAAGDERTALAGYYQGLSSVRNNGMYPDTVRYVNATQGHKARYR